MSTKRKKKTESEKVSPLTDKGYRLKFNSAGGGYYRVGRSPLDDALESEEELLVHEMKSMRIDEMNLKRRARMTKLQKEIDKLEKEGEDMDSSSSDMPRISVAMAQQIASLPPEERDKVIETYAMFSSIAQSKGRGDSLLPLIIGYSKSNPGTQQSDMVAYAKAMSDQFKTGIEVMKTIIPKEKPSDATALLKIYSDLVKDSVKKPLEDLAKNMQPQPSAFEQILMNPEMFARAKDIGMFGSKESTTGSTSIDLEIEKMRGERELQIKQLDLSWRKSLLETEAKDRRSDTILAALAPLTALFAGPVTQRIQNLGAQQGAAHIPRSVTPLGTPPAVTTILLHCSETTGGCGYKGPMTFSGPVSSPINCPKCGLELQLGGAQPETD